MTAGGAGVDAVRQRVKALAERGVFNGWREVPGIRGKTAFGFRWLLGADFTLVVDPASGELVARDLLPGIEHRSFIDKDLRKFVAGRADPALPAHRRLDPERAGLAYRNRKRSVSLVMRSHDGDLEYAVKTFLTALNDLFTYLHLYHIDYLQRHFGVPEE